MQGSPGAPAGKLRELYRYREILLMLVLRDLQARTKQAYLGYLWILVQPLLLTGAFTFLVRNVLGRSDLSDVPYPVFLMAALIPWQFFATSLNDSAESLVKNVDLVRQVYFPREILAVYPIVARLVDVAIATVALGVLMLAFGVAPSPWMALLPAIILVEMLFLAALGLLLAAANVAWRDVARALPLLLQLLIFAMPVLYTLDRVPEWIRPVYLLNPIARLIEGFRGAALGTNPPSVMELGVLALTGVVALVLAQRLFSVFDAVLADVI